MFKKSDLENPNMSLAKENGFSSVQAMGKAHEPILRLACEVLPQEGGNVLDLGCGNGVLLKALKQRHESVIPYGIEYNLDALKSAKLLQREFSDNFFQGDLFDAENILPKKTNFALTIIMPGRIVERLPKNPQVKSFLEWLSFSSKEILGYAYADWIKKYNGLENILDLAGFEITQKDSLGTAAIINIE